MAYTFYNSKADGTPDAQITSGEVGALFSTLTSQERINGDTEFSKLWIQSDADVTLFIGIKTPSPYTSTLFLSASTDTDTAADITGSETKYGALEVVSVADPDITVKNNPDYVLVRVNDDVIVSGDAYNVTAIVDNGDGTSTITLNRSMAYVPAAGDFVTSVITLNLVTATPGAVWREETVPVGASWYAEFASADILIAD